MDQYEAILILFGLGYLLKKYRDTTGKISEIRTDLSKGWYGSTYLRKYVYKMPRLYPWEEERLI